MKFEEMRYERLVVADFVEKFEDLLCSFEEAESLEEQFSYLEKINKHHSHLDTMYNLCSVRHTIDTNDSFYEKENNYFDEVAPNFEELSNRFYQALLQARFRKGLEKKLGRQLFTIAELSINTFRPEIVEDLQTENRLRSDFVKITATAEIDFQGEKLNLSTIIPYETSTDRHVRKAACEAKWKYYEERADTLENIFDELVKVRHQIALKLGYKNFIELGYMRMLRSDYDAEKVAKFRDLVAKYVVPLATELRKRQAKRLGLDSLYYYDEGFGYPSGNPKPQGDAEWIIQQAKQMYDELSPETSEFFNFLLENNLMDLVSKQGKATGGYCTYIADYKAPFIFSNFNGTKGDIDVLTHEAGHAFQVYSSRHWNISQYYFPTYEACEIHSMSMEFFTWDWMALFFGEEVEKYKFVHLSEALLFLPYGVAIDEFQHEVYANPELSPAERRKIWRKIEQKYLPQRNYADNEFLKTGTLWIRQNHIYASPFYYIDYTLAQLCAFQFWQKSRSSEKAQAWDDYLRLCKAGGSQSFLELVKLANLHSPFEEQAFTSSLIEVKKYLDSVDDTKF